MAGKHFPEQKLGGGATEIVEYFFSQK